MDFDYWLRAGVSHQVQHLPSKFATLRLQPEAKSIANLDQFAAELVRVYTSFFAVNQNAKAFHNIKNDAMANIYFRAADCSFWAKDFAAARHYAKSSRRHKKWPPRSLWGWIFLGQPGRFIAQKTLGNPYLP